jgi:hypothetical protein
VPDSANAYPGPSSPATRWASIVRAPWSASIGNIKLSSYLGQPRFVPGGPTFPVTIAVLADLDPVWPTLNLPSATVTYV